MHSPRQQEELVYCLPVTTNNFETVEKGDDVYPELYFRKIEPKDRRQVQQLHEEWFPVRYEESFYEELVYNTMHNEPLYTCVAVRKDLAAAEKGEEDIVACAIGSFLKATRLSGNMQKILIQDNTRHSKLFYLMTLGTVKDYRGHGLGQQMVLKCIEQVHRDVQCGALYLHVITYNNAAIRLYEKLGFSRVTEIPNYYKIHDENYNCYLYAKYFHGKRRVSVDVWYDDGSDNFD